MKAKVKFDLATVKRWLLENGEKVAFGLMVLVFLMFTVSAVRRETLEPSKQKERLDSLTDEVKNHVTSSTFKAKEVGIVVVDYSLLAERTPVDGKSFEIGHAYNPILPDPKGKRGEPEVFVAEEPRAVGGYGVFAVLTEAPELGNTAKAVGTGSKTGFKPGSSSKLKPQPWVVVTALAPRLKQEREYEQRFARTAGERNRDRDLPEYYECVLERAEISGGAAGKLDWKKVGPPVDKPPVDNDWESYVEEDPLLVPKEVIAFVEPLGPLVYAPWGDAVTHPKLIEEMEAIERAKEPEKPATQSPANPVRRGRPADKTREAPPPAPNPADKPAKAEPLLEHHLLRAFDFSVEPNKRYKYRMKVRLTNPNFQVEVRYLSNPDSAKEEFIESDWSQETAIVTVPDATQLLSGVVNTASKTNEPTATILVSTIEPKEGVEAATEIDVTRGSVANVHRAKVIATNPRNTLPMELLDVDFHSGQVVLDIRGGKTYFTKKDKSLTSPGDVLVLDALGNLKVHNELEDASAYENRLPPHE